MALTPLHTLVLFALGAAVAPLGDHVHVATGTTAYTTDSVPFIWDSPAWFPVLVGLGTVAVAETRLRLGAPRGGLRRQWAPGLVAAVMGTYAMTGMLIDQPSALGVTLIAAIAAVAWTVVGDARGALCGLLAAVGGTAIEALMVHAGLFSYAANSSQLAGVAAWLPCLYFTFGVATSVLAELLVTGQPHPELAEQNLTHRQ